MEKCSQRVAVTCHKPIGLDTCCDRVLCSNKHGNHSKEVQISDYGSAGRELGGILGGGSALFEFLGGAIGSSIGQLGTIEWTEHPTSFNCARGAGGVVSLLCYISFFTAVAIVLITVRCLVKINHDPPAIVNKLHIACLIGGISMIYFALGGAETLIGGLILGYLISFITVIARARYIKVNGITVTEAVAHQGKDVSKRFAASFAKTLKGLFKFSGRAKRLEYWIFALIYLSLLYGVCAECINMEVAMPLAL